ETERRAAHLERAGALQDLELQADGLTRHLGQVKRVLRRRVLDHAREASGGLLDLREGRNRRRSCLVRRVDHRHPFLRSSEPSVFGTVLQMRSLSGGSPVRHEPLASVAATTFTNAATGTANSAPAMPPIIDPPATT